jgi:hypothetical protein
MRGRKWTEDEDEYIRQQVDRSTYAEIGEKIDRAADAVRVRSRALGLAMPSSRWTEKEDGILRANMDLSCAELATRLGRTAWAIQERYNVLGLKKGRGGSGVKRAKPGRPVGSLNKQKNPDVKGAVFRVRLACIERAEAIRCAEIVGESESEFIRGAIAMRCKKTR